MVNLRTLAEQGARLRLQELAEERAQILKAFPSLGNGTPAARAMRAVVALPKRRRRSMTKSQRKEVSQRMTAYWAERRAQKQGARK